MNLYEQWQNLINSQTDETFDDFWEKYSSAETRIYSGILDDPGKNVTGTLKDLSEKYAADHVIFMGFLDGINTSLKNEQSFKEFDENSEVGLEIDYEKLYFNMLEANADYLYTLPQWDNILTEEKRQEIVMNWKKSKTVVKDKKPGRNDSCPCGSGKKFKKCCGAN
ncbi:MAG: SEC-C metal-binding domain-containing protein [Eubacteriales bacterium]|nr:SEC-C metal-binding domain-containing protein [Eubacteriales bacterium]MDD3198854.1 SEC-C metal-binding domain-containing protein [Eubacteriales bacterium]MDD4122548.1 SEC-C metal-binding domain-containing protein [Eubacteriales bacterium]MDD4629247.1 SEC-C metal-binding domain-containing protein [Eubacteriales bacterium]